MRLTSSSFLYAFVLALGFAACGPGTWREAAQQADLGVSAHPDDPARRVVAAETALLVKHDHEAARRHLDRALLKAQPHSPQAARAALAAIHLAVVSGDIQGMLPAIERSALTPDPVAAEAIVGAVGLLWGRTPDAGAVPPELHTLLGEVAQRQGAAWEPARTEARNQLLTAAEMWAKDPAVADARERAGLITDWRLSAPWGQQPTLDMEQTLGPETRPLKASEQTGYLWDTRARKTWRMRFSDGELTFFDIPPDGGVGFAETWISLPTEARDRRVVLRVEANQPYDVYAGDKRVLSRRAGDPWQQRVGLVLPASMTRIAIKLAAPTGRGFARAQVTHLLGTHDPLMLGIDAAPPTGVGAAPATFTPPSSFVESFPRSVVGVDSGAAIRALHVFEALLHRPVRDERGAREVLDAVASSLGDYPGLAVLDARLAAIGKELTQRAARGQMRAALEQVLEAWPGNHWARRRLAQVELGDERYDRAVELLEGVLELAPRDGPTLILLMNVYAKRGWEAQALEVADRLAELAAAGPRVLQEVADLYAGFGYLDRATEAIDRLEQLFPRAAESRRAKLALDRGDVDTHAALLTRAWEREPHKLSLLHQAVRALRAVGRLERAAELVDKVAAWRAEDPWVLSERLNLALARGERAEALAHLAPLLDIAPRRSLEELHSYLSGTDGAKDTTGVLADGRALVEGYRSRVVKDSPELGRYPVVTLLDRWSFDVRADGTALQLVHLVRVVQSKEGADRFGDIRPPGDARLLVLRTLKADGTEVWPERVPGKPDVSFSGLQPGDAIEWAWIVRDQVKPELGGYLGGGAFATWGIPTLAKRLDVKVAPELSLRWSLRSGAPTPEIRATKDGGKHFTWRADNLPIVPPESNRISARLFFPLVDLAIARGDADPDSDQAIWREIARGYSDTLTRLGDPGPRTLELAAELTRELPAGTLAAAWAAFDWVKQKLNAPESQNEFGTHVERALANKKGNRALVLWSLLGALKVQAEILLCAPLSNGPHADAERPVTNANRFGYPIVRIDTGDTLAFLDVNRPYFPFGVLEEALGGARCLQPMAVLDDKRSLWTRLPAAEQASSRGLRHPVGWTVDLRLDVDPAGTARGTLKLSGYGPRTAALRQVYQTYDQAKQELLWQRWTADAFPGSRVLDAATLNAAASDKPLEVTLEVEIPKLMTLAGGQLRADRVGPLFFAHSLSAVPTFESLISLPERETPLGMPSHSETLVVRLRLPEGASVETDLGAVDLELPLAEVSQRVQAEGRTLELTRSIRLRPGRIEPSDYPAFRARLTEAATDLLRPVRASAPAQ